MLFISQMLPPPHAASFAGRMVNPQLAHPQNEGNVIFGLGPALLEEMVADNGQIIKREELGLVGAREGCGVGMCGACTVLVNDQPISSCLMLAVQADGTEITTIEGLSSPDGLHPVQQAFIEHAAFQCAYCTSGFILSAVALLKQQPRPDEAAIRDYLAGNLCRCGSLTLSH